MHNQQDTAKSRSVYRCLFAVEAFLSPASTAPILNHFQHHASSNLEPNPILEAEPEELLHFLYPCPPTIHESMDFALTDSCGELHYVTCRTRRSGHEGSVLHTLGLTSGRPIFVSMRACLCEVDATRNHSMALEFLWKLMYEFVDQTHTTLILSNTRKFIVPQVRSGTPESSLALPFRVLSVNHVILVFGILLLERYSVIFRASSPTLLTRVTVAFLSFLAPLKWEWVYIPLVPNRLRELLDVPTLAILGFHESNALESRLGQVVVDLDDDNVMLGDCQVLMLPRRKALAHALRLALEPELRDLDGYENPALNRNRLGGSQDMEADSMATLARSKVSLADGLDQAQKGLCELREIDVDHETSGTIARTFRDYVQGLLATCQVHVGEDGQLNQTHELKGKSRVSRFSKMLSTTAMFHSYAHSIRMSAEVDTEVSRAHPSRGKGQDPDSTLSLRVSSAQAPQCRSTKSLKEAQLSALDIDGLSNLSFEEIHHEPGDLPDASIQARSFVESISGATISEMLQYTPESSMRQYLWRLLSPNERDAILEQSSKKYVSLNDLACGESRSRVNLAGGAISTAGLAIQSRSKKRRMLETLAGLQPGKLLNQCPQRPTVISGEALMAASRELLESLLRACTRVCQQESGVWILRHKQQLLDCVKSTSVWNQAQTLSGRILSAKPSSFHTENERSAFLVNVANALGIHTLLRQANTHRDGRWVPTPFSADTYRLGDGLSYTYSSLMAGPLKCPWVIPSTTGRGAKCSTSGWDMHLHMRKRFRFLNLLTANIDGPVIRSVSPESIGAVTREQCTQYLLSRNAKVVRHGLRFRVHLPRVFERIAEHAGLSSQEILECLSQLVEDRWPFTGALKEALETEDARLKVVFSPDPVSRFGVRFQVKEE